MNLETLVHNKQDLRMDQMAQLTRIKETISYSPIEGLPFFKSGFEFDVVQNHEVLEESFKVAFQNYSDPAVSYIDRAQFPLGMLFDTFDAASTHFIARNQRSGTLVGALRMIHDTPLGLQVDLNLDVSDYRQRYKIAEISRLVVYPMGQPPIADVLIEQYMRAAKSFGVQKVLCEGPTIMKEYHEKHIGLVPMDPKREWKLSSRGSWSSKHDYTIYGSVRHLDQEMPK